MFGVGMRREIDINEISDGKLYNINDMVKADCQDCQGCSSCCQGMGQSIVLDTLDIWNLKKNLGVGFEALIEKHIELNVVDHIILPNLKMNKKNECCNFLDENGRCSIHAFRPGICRIFPLGRIYEKGGFQYFLQVNECHKTNRSKIKVSKWIDCKEVKRNQQFIAKWHYLLKDVEQMILASEEEDALRKVSMYLLHQFYTRDMIGDSFDYQQVEEKIEQAREDLGV